jgi:hypothetical protein
MASLSIQDLFYTPADSLYLVDRVPTLGISFGDTLPSQLFLRGDRSGDMVESPLPSRGKVLDYWKCTSVLQHCISIVVHCGICEFFGMADMY